LFKHSFIADDHSTDHVVSKDKEKQICRTVATRDGVVITDNTLFWSSIHHPHRRPSIAIRNVNRKYRHAPD